MPDESTPLEITFTIATDDVWIDPAGVSWYVKFTSGDRVHFERTVAAEEDATTVAQKWRKVEKKK